MSINLPSIITIGSRDSELALLQSNMVKSALESLHQGLEVRILKIKTKGDLILDQALSKIGDKGLFVKELEYKLLDNTIDLAVHSLKDMMTTLPSGLEIAAVSKRANVKDVVCLSKHAKERGISSLTEAEVIASSSLRRVAQLKHRFKDANKTFVDIRGNLNTRLKKLDDPASKMDAVILAAAGIERLMTVNPVFEGRISEYLDPELMLPAVSQGALGIEINSARTDIKDLLKPYNDLETFKITQVERAFLRTLEGGCHAPIGIYSQKLADKYRFNACICDLAGQLKLEDYVESDILSESVGIRLADKLLESGASKLLARQ
jgi:hydroxymethylbilane synthase